MSDESQGHGWWQASDGKWYPPEAHAEAAPAPPQKKRRIWLWVLVGFFVLLGGCGALVVLAADEVADEIERQDAEALTQVTCRVIGADFLSDVEFELTADNTTSGRSDFFIEVELLAADGSFLGDGTGSLTNIPAGQQLTDTGFTTVDFQDGVTCNVIDVTRLASS